MTSVDRMSSRASRFALSVVFFALAGAILFAGGVRAFGSGAMEDLWPLFAFLGLAVCVVTGWIATSRPALARSSLPPVPTSPAASTAYRGDVPPAAIARTSARRTTAVLIASLAVTAAVVPFALHLPRWVEGEIVMVVWWLVWSLVLGIVAHRGEPVHDDHVGGSVTASLPVKPRWRWASAVFEGASDPEGCVYALALVVLVGLALAGAWFVVELVAPAVFLVAYRGVVRALARVRLSETKGSVLRSALVGVTWATAYTAPLAAVVALAHLASRAAR